MKYIKLKCTKSELKNFWDADRLYKGRIIEDGTVEVRDNYGVWFALPENKVMVGEPLGGVSLTAHFIELKTKTILCTWVNHSLSVKKSFRKGKRYQIEQGRALGAVAGGIFDEEGHRWNLYRNDIGFSVGEDLARFEAAYR